MGMTACSRSKRTTCRTAGRRRPAAGCRSTHCAHCHARFDPMPIRNFALIGCGTISDFHAQALRGIEGTRLVVVAEQVEARAKAFAERNGCDFVTDYHALLKRPDVQIVCVTTPSGSHAPIGMDVLRAGKHLVL